MPDWPIGHTALTWEVLSKPLQIETALRDCAELGYSGTETGGFVYDWFCRERPGEFERVIERYGVKMACLFHSGPWTDPGQTARLIADAQRWADALQMMGGEVLMLVPGGRRAEPAYTRDEFEVMADAMMEAGRRAQQAGIVAAVHPHWGTVVETREEIELLLELLDPAVVGFAPDSGQIAKGGADPVPIFREYADRIRHVHLKDLSPEWEEMKRAGVPLRSPAGYAELGEGLIDFPSIFEIVRAAGYSGWLMAELDETRRTARQSAEISMRYLRGHLG